MNNLEYRTISNELYFEEVQSLLNQGKEVCIRVKGNSMLPFIKNGDRVLLVAYSGTPVPIGSNILARHDGKFIFHRYVGKKKNMLVLAGDGNLGLREYITSADILAIALKLYPGNSAMAVDINSSWPRTKGMMWYHLRTIRSVFASLKRRLIR